ncbi:hypothetical protein [Microvirgula aerodenitrificans]|uniref:hypothetical protein n=1 Tax=Microvirgula aerodenitrificans TaxID=57480 RepID=UPI0012EB476D|nr:hypothetical protein [Microvirgula aerodenitrificans]
MSKDGIAFDATKNTMLRKFLLGIKIKHSRRETKEVFGWADTVSLCEAVSRKTGYINPRALKLSATESGVTSHFSFAVLSMAIKTAPKGALCDLVILLQVSVCVLIGAQPFELEHLSFLVNAQSLQDGLARYSLIFHRATIPIYIEETDAGNIVLVPHYTGNNGVGKVRKFFSGSFERSMDVCFKQILPPKFFRAKVVKEFVKLTVAHGCFCLEGIKQQADDLTLMRSNHLFYPII